MGRIAAPHGVRGAFRVQPLSADPASLLDFPRWWIRSGDASEWKAYQVASSRVHSGSLVAELAGVTTRDAAGALRGASIGVPHESLPALADDEYYQADLVGMAVVNRGGDVLGTVVDFVDSGAHPIVRVAPAQGGERLIPWVEQYIDRVDVAARRIDVDWPIDY
jgi:16S rRNA processing protein RimM